MVWGNVYGYQRAGAAVLQPAVCGIGAVQPEEARRGRRRLSGDSLEEWKGKLDPYDGSVYVF